MYSVLYIIYAIYCQLIYSPLAEVVTRDVINILNEVIYSKPVVYSKLRELSVFLAHIGCWAIVSSAPKDLFFILLFALSSRL